MKRAQTLLVSVLLAVSALGASTQATFAAQAEAWSNSDAFSSRCLGFTDTYPQQLYSLASAQMRTLGYSPVGGAIGPAFTTSTFLNNVYPDYAVYVHSHGDNYNFGSGTDSAFLQDPGTSRCADYTKDAVRSTAIKKATAGGPFNLVIMSTCYLGASTASMPNGFQIAKVKNATRREFYLGYVYSTWDSDSLRFEQAFWSYINGDSVHRRTAYQAFTYAVSIGGYSAVNSSNPFQPNWWGNPSYNGLPG